MLLLLLLLFYRHFGFFLFGTLISNILLLLLSSRRIFAHCHLIVCRHFATAVPSLSHPNAPLYCTFQLHLQLNYISTIKLFHFYWMVVKCFLLMFSAFLLPARARLLHRFLPKTYFVFYIVRRTRIAYACIVSGPSFFALWHYHSEAFPKNEKTIFKLHWNVVPQWGTWTWLSAIDVLPNWSRAEQSETKMS